MTSAPTVRLTGKEIDFKIDKTLQSPIKAATIAGLDSKVNSVFPKAIKDGPVEANKGAPTAAVGEEEEEEEEGGGGEGNTIASETTTTITTTDMATKRKAPSKKAVMRAAMEATATKRPAATGNSAGKAEAAGRVVN